MLLQHFICRMHLCGVSPSAFDSGCWNRVSWVENSILRGTGIVRCNKRYCVADILQIDPLLLPCCSRGFWQWEEYSSTETWVCAGRLVQRAQFTYCCVRYRPAATCGSMYWFHVVKPIWWFILCHQLDPKKSSPERNCRSDSNPWHYYRHSNQKQIQDSSLAPFAE